MNWPAILLASAGFGAGVALIVRLFESVDGGYNGDQFLDVNRVYDWELEQDYPPRKRR